VAPEGITESALLNAVRDLLADVTDLFKKEVRLARAEITESLGGFLQAGIWMAAAGLLGFIALLLVIEAVVFGLSSLGIAPHWACLIVAAVLAAGAAGAFFYGRSLAVGSVVPSRTMSQVKRDISTAQEQLS